MGISNQIPNSRLAQPGVCTSTTRPASPFEGQVIYETDTNRVLVYDGSAWVMIADTDTPPALQLIKTQTIGSAVASVEVTDCFSADYDAYKITVTGGSCSASENIRLKLGASSTGYYDVIFYVASNALTTPQTAGTANTAAQWARVGAADGNGIQVDINLINPGLAKYTSFIANYNYSGATVFFGVASGLHQVATAYTSMTISPGSGTLTGGTIRVYGYRNS